MNIRTLVKVVHKHRLAEKLLWAVAANVIFWTLAITWRELL